MTTAEIIVDWAQRIMLGVGFPAILLFWFKDRRRLRLDADQQEKEQPFRVRSTAASTLDSEVAALQKSFEVRENNLIDTITDQAKTIIDLRTEDERKEVIITELKRKVRLLQDQLDIVSREAASLQTELSSVSLQLDQLQDNKKA